MRTGLALLLLAGTGLAGCVPPAVQAPPPAVPAPPPPRPYAPTGLETVLGASAAALVAQFGQPDLDAREGPARKLQFLGAACVLDAYLYPPRGGRGEAVVTHVDARLPDGREMDRSSCVAALSRRREAQ
ncbi:MAG: hypothetical protein KF780_01265 [Sphingomonas sp.]|nr:hypothetical protein [Sphingomonas sp.]